MGFGLLYRHKNTTNGRSVMERLMSITPGYYYNRGSSCGRLRNLDMVNVVQRTGAGQPAATVIYNYSI